MIKSQQKKQMEITEKFYTILNWYTAGIASYLKFIM